VAGSTVLPAAVGVAERRRRRSWTAVGFGAFGAAERGAVAGPRCGTV